MEIAADYNVDFVVVDTYHHIAAVAVELVTVIELVTVTWVGGVIELVIVICW